MDKVKKEKRYERLFKQIADLLKDNEYPLASMSTIVAVLHHKMDYFFWTGFYLHKEGKLIVGPYQGPVACQELEKDKGVCWAAYHERSDIVVPDVHAFPGHISCDSRSISEITVPVFDLQGQVSAIFDVDSDRHDSFN